MMSARMQKFWDQMEAIDQFVSKNGYGIIPAGNSLERFRFKVLVRHEDGSTMFFEDAYSILFEQYLLVYTEHTGNHIFHVDDLCDTMGWCMYARNEIPHLSKEVWDTISNMGDAPGSVDV